MMKENRIKFNHPDGSLSTTLGICLPNGLSKAFELCAHMNWSLGSPFSLLSYVSKINFNFSNYLSIKRLTGTLVGSVVVKSWN